LISLLDTTSNAKSKLSLYLSPKCNAFALFASRKTTNHISRRKKENTRKARDRKRKRGELRRSALYKFLFKALCFSDGYSSTTNSQHAFCDVGINVDALKSLTNSSNVKKLKCLISQGCFALDTLPTTYHTTDRLECQ